MYYEEVLKTLNKKRIKYLVAGGFAVNLHGVPRMTQDLDLLADLSQKNITKLLMALSELGYTPRPPVDIMDFADEKKRAAMIASKNMIAFPLVHKKSPGQEIDILAVSPVSFQKAEKNKVLKKTRRVSIPIVGIGDLITMKKASARKHDISDIAMLKKVRALARKSK